MTKEEWKKFIDQASQPSLFMKWLLKDSKKKGTKAGEQR